MYRLHDSARVHENWDNRVKTDLRANLVKTDLRANLVKPKATGKNVNEQPNLARVRETGRTSAKHSHLAKKHCVSEVIHGRPGKPCKNGLTGKNVNDKPNLARVRETGRTSAKHSHLGKNTVFRRCFMVARANLGKTDLRAKT